MHIHAVQLITYVPKEDIRPVYHLRNLTIHKLNQEQEKRVREIFGMKPGDLYNQQAMTDFYRACKREPLLKDYTYGYTIAPDRTAAMVDLTLEFEIEPKGDDSSVTIH